MAQKQKQKQKQKEKSGNWITYSILIVVVGVLFVYNGQGSNSIDATGSSGASGMEPEVLAVDQVYNVTCATEREAGDTCRPKGTKCGRMIRDGFASAEEVEALIALIDQGIGVGPGGAGPPSILDLQSGAVSYNEQFIDVYRGMEQRQQTFTASYVDVFRNIKDRILDQVRQDFGLPEEEVHLTQPFFFSRISANKEAKTFNDEYWHNHIDELQYGSFDFTVLLYLNDYETDFTGGTFTFDDTARGGGLATVIPKPGRLLMFTSGPENVHRVDPVTSGTRYALVIAFTCDSSKAVTDFLPKMTSRVLS